MFILAFDWGEVPWEELILEFNPWDASLLDFLMARCIKAQALWQSQVPAHYFLCQIFQQLGSSFHVQIRELVGSPPWDSLVWRSEKARWWRNALCWLSVAWWLVLLAPMWLHPGGYVRHLFSSAWFSFDLFGAGVSLADFLLAVSSIHPARSSTDKETIQGVWVVIGPHHTSSQRFGGIIKRKKRPTVFNV